MFNNWLDKHYIKVLGALIGVDFLFFGLTNASKVSVLILVIGFILLTINIYMLVTGVVKLLRWYGINLGESRNRITLMISGFLAAIVAFQSTGQLTLKDMVVLIPFILGAYFYTSYKKA